MDDIHIKKFSGDPHLRGCIEPEDGSWQLLIDHQGIPHLLVRAPVELDDGSVGYGYVALENLLGATTQDVMTTTFGRFEEELG